MLIFWPKTFYKRAQHENWPKRGSRGRATRQATKAKADQKKKKKNKEKRKNLIESFDTPFAAFVTHPDSPSPEFLLFSRLSLPSLSACSCITCGRGGAASTAVASSCLLYLAKVCHQLRGQVLPTGAVAVVRWGLAGLAARICWKYVYGLLHALQLWLN